MIPASQNITIRRGDTFRLFFRLRTKLPDGSPGDYPDLTAWGEGLAQIRANSDATETLASFTITKANQTTYPGGILLSLSKLTTTSLALATGAVWDFEIDNELGETDTYLAGTVTFVKDVSR